MFQYEMILKIVLLIIDLQLLHQTRLVKGQLTSVFKVLIHIVALLISKRLADEISVPLDNPTTVVNDQEKGLILLFK